MAQENVEIIRAGIDAYNRGDWDGALEHAAPNFVLDMSRSIGPQRGMYELDQMRPYFENFAATFESVRIEAEEFIGMGEHVVVPNTTHVRGRDGIEARARTAMVFTFRDGAVVRLAMYQARQDALEAVGLRE